MNNVSANGPLTPSTEQEHGPIFVQYVSAVTGRVYNNESIDHLADMLLIFYCGGGTSLGAVTGALLGLRLMTSSTNAISGLFGILCFGFVGSLAGCLLVMIVLNFRGVLKWDGAVVRRSIRLKK
jgi:hypothetical protein